MDGGHGRAGQDKPAREKCDLVVITALQKVLDVILHARCEVPQQRQSREERARVSPPAPRARPAAGTSPTPAPGLAGRPRPPGVPAPSLRRSADPSSPRRRPRARGAAAPRRAQFHLDIAEIGLIREMLSGWSDFKHDPLVLEIAASPDLVVAGSDSGGEDAGAGTLLERWTLHYEGYETASQSPAEVKASLRAVLKRIKVLLRTLFAFLRILPAHLLLRRAASARPAAPRPPRFGFALRSPGAAASAQLPPAGRAPDFPESSMDSLGRYAFPQVVFPFGSLHIAVEYRKDALLAPPAAAAAPSPLPLQDPAIIHDYRASPEATDAHQAAPLSGLGRLLQQAAVARGDRAAPRAAHPYDPSTDWLPRPSAPSPPSPAHRAPGERSSSAARNAYRRRNTAPIPIAAPGASALEAAASGGGALGATAPDATDGALRLAMGGGDAAPAFPPPAARQTSRSLDWHGRSPLQQRPEAFQRLNGAPARPAGGGVALRDGEGVGVLRMTAGRPQELGGKEERQRQSRGASPTDGHRPPLPQGVAIPHAGASHSGGAAGVAHSFSPFGSTPPFLCDASAAMRHPLEATGVQASSPPFPTACAAPFAETSPATSPLQTAARRTLDFSPRATPTQLPAVVEGGLSSMLSNPFLLEGNPVKLAESMSAVCPIVARGADGAAAPPAADEVAAAAALPFAPCAEEAEEEDRAASVDFPTPPMLRSLAAAPAAPEQRRDAELQDYRRLLQQLRTTT